MHGGADTYLRLLNQFKINHGNDLQSLKEHINNNKYDEAHHIAHTLKGTAGTLGLSHLSEVAYKIDNILRSQGDTKITDEIYQLIDTAMENQNNLHQVLEQMTIKVPDKPTGLKKKMTPEEIKAMLEKLKTLLEMDDTQVNALFFDYEDQLELTFNKEVKNLGQKIEQFEYPAALTILNSMLESLDKLINELDGLR